MGSDTVVDLAQQTKKRHVNRTGVEPAAQARAFATWLVVGEHTDFAGGMVLVTPLHAHTHVAISPRSDLDIVVEAGGHSSTFTLAQMGDEGPVTLARRAAHLIQAMIQRQLLSRESKGFDITVASSIPSGLGVGEDAAFDTALALALAHRLEERDSAPVRAKLAEVTFQAAASHSPAVAVRARYATILRGRPGFVNVVDYADGAITQASVPATADTALFAVRPPKVGAPLVAEIVRRQEFHQQAAKAFGADSLRALPDAHGRVIEWLRAVHQVRGADGTPTELEATQWLTFQVQELQAATSVAQAIRALNSAEAYSLLSRSQDSIDELFGCSGVESHVAQLCRARGAVAARAAHAGVSTAAIAVVADVHADRFIESLTEDGFKVERLELHPGD